MAAMLTGDWLHFVFTAANLKWMLSPGKQPYCDSLPSLPSVQLTHFPHPSNIKHPSPLCPLSWWLGFSFHRENKHNPKKMFFPAHSHLPYGLSLYPHALSFFLLWWGNDLGSSLRLMFLLIHWTSSYSLTQGLYSCNLLPSQWHCRFSFLLDH